MTTTSHHRRLISSLAILAVLLNALLPSLSQAMAAASAAVGGSVQQGAAPRWQELCSATGSRWVQLDAQGHLLAQTDQRPTEAPPASHDAACGYCLAHAGSFGLPPETGWLVGLAGESRTPLAARPEQAPTLRLAWRNPAVRAPPAGGF